MSALRVGIAGLGSVGANVFQLLKDNAGLISARAGRQLVVTAVSARDKSKKRGLDMAAVAWHDNPVAMADDPNVDVVVELMGGATGAAHDLVMKALQNGKAVVTANKALLSAQAAEIQKALAAGKGSIAYEAAVAGGIPAIKGLREGLAANNIQAVYGILNGTCNFILTEMRTTKRDFADVLKEAQDKGYAEADPTFDIDGIDASHKLSILSALAFGVLPDVSSIKTSGIRHITALDIEFADELGYRIKLLGIARQTAGGIEQSVEPCLVPKAAPIASVEGALNAVYINGDYSGKILLMGAGAGGKPTASAVVADIIDVARGHRLPLLAISPDRVSALKPADMRARKGSYYLRLIVLDQPGVIADVSAILRDEKVSLESVLQRGHAPEQPVPVILTTHGTEEGAIQRAVEKISKLKSVAAPPHLMRIETFE